MHLLRWDQILDRLWLAASGAAALALALDLGAQVGSRGWSSDGAVLTALAGRAPDAAGLEPTRPGMPAARRETVSVTRPALLVRTGAGGGTEPGSGP
ncbi:hypothetical protein ABIE45_000118 [Methylobacterium sp. OAE515]|uniref:hypothetical protein n=1 Tax=Methylobacterium sp. OAE515 TaxID=2817895 RepID=UPI00178AD2B1